MPLSKILKLVFILDPGLILLMFSLKTKSLFLFFSKIQNLNSAIYRSNTVFIIM